MPINPLIREKLRESVPEHGICSFIEEILEIERTHKARHGKKDEYDKALARHVRKE